MTEVIEKPAMVLPSPQVQQFLLELIEKAAFPGVMIDFVALVREDIRHAQITPKD